ncbi:MAG: ATP-binding protein [Myxococcales bacterium]|nr:ATP-binding protein [Myxococcales bacterium]
MPDGSKESEAANRVARDVVESLLEGCQVIGFDWRYLYVNDAVVQQGQRAREDLLGRTMMECYPGIDETPMFATLRRCMEERSHERLENEFTFPDGSTGFFELRFLPVVNGACVLSMDITQRKRSEAALARTEEQLRHAQKMEAVGRLAGGVAHDFNNLLSVVLSYTGLMLHNLPDDHPHHPDLHEIQRAGLRAAELTRQLLTFSRHRVVQPAVIDLNQLVAGMHRMIARLLGPAVEVTVLPGSELGRVKADAGQLEQVLMNLVVNARDAMPRGGKLTIQTGDVALDEEYARQHLGVVPGPYVKLVVTDTGTGMDRATQAHIFEPFFTTKGVGHGTGLGLATVFGIVQQSGGHIWVYSEPGHGTTFKVYLPRALEGDDAWRSTAPTAAVPSGAPATGTILLVEDDEYVRASTGNVLRRAGYEVIEAASAMEALDVAERFDGVIHLLLTDVVLPRVAGPELAQMLRHARPGLPVLFMSGYTDEAIVGHGILETGLPYVEKPITVELLTRRVREAMGGP